MIFFLNNLSYKIDIYTFSFSTEFTFSSISYLEHKKLDFSRNNFHSEIAFKFLQNKNMERATNTELNVRFLGRKTDFFAFFFFLNVL